ncbi:FHA domain-containing protein [Kitasatospora aureofaciens]|uniref:ABC transporter ATP-binding protein n=1 Tax=Kitasatospora aureofaciens TaxID=1894 RepID=A0A1E7N8M6_KITAU|nr:FHA domain-containing protein [Kitasatospora aureofaciens]QEU98196.1 ATP-binding cassette domain-containing protein [Streptomyces viridifaciens]ARF82393.1 ABC transporter ATP-binding protein [Kitasatospora aureofaciens]OEV36823.1 ABC transporter ATP-binding protein [Kitasatospora aureofaciens]UKZ04080.1 ATP-binding cassette domain-containing protein [Streptomyces viridifaciens]GGU70435.1 ABC transporter ATP-binding protein [Kitasatospora aureofaciens]
MGERPGAPTAPPLVLVTDRDSRLIDPTRAYHLGRDPTSEIVLDDPRVSWHHAVLRTAEGHWLLEDVGSTNGTYDEGRRVDREDIGPGTRLRFGDPATGPSATFAGLPAPAAEPAAAEHPTLLAPQSSSVFRSPSAVLELPGPTVRIGRAPDNDLVLDDLLVSRHHAELRELPDGRHEIVDLGSHNGTYLNGLPVRHSPIGPADIVGIGHSEFCLVDGRLVEYDDTGEVSLDVQHLVVRVGPDQRVLLDDVGFPLTERTLLAVAGPSGAGKSTLLNALTGLRPADEGTVLYDGRDLYHDYAELRRRIGLVPQDDILHTQLTVHRALSYAAELRFPGDTAADEREGRVSEVIRELGLEERADQVIASLSGGQRKRVSIALELLTKPSLLFLDEPTSGLDPGMERSVMRMLRGLADDGRTVVVVTHSVLSLNVCDRLLVLAPGGRTAYYGPPTEALEYFGEEEWPEAFESFESDSEGVCQERFRASPQYRQYVAAEAAHPAQPPAASAPVIGREKPQSWFAQLGTLVRRYAAVLAADRLFLTVMVVLPFLIGAMCRVMAGSRLTDENAINCLLTLCLGGVLIGSANAVREVVKERAIYRRERVVGLSRSAYLVSKVVVLGIVTIAQSALLTVVGLAGVTLTAQPRPNAPPPVTSGVLMPQLPELILSIALLAFTSMVLGLVVSAFVGKEETTMPLLVLLAIVQVVFSGLMLKLHGVPGLEQFAWLIPSRWGLAAMARTVDLGRLIAPSPITDDPMFRHERTGWLIDMAALLALAVAYGLAVLALLRRREPTIMRK